MPESFDLVCLSHLRWDFVYQRPQQLLSRCARDRRVLYVEEPVLDADAPRLDVTPRGPGVSVAVAHLPAGLREQEVDRLQGELVSAALPRVGIDRYVAWYYTPMALGFTRQLRPLATVYDCMDELTGFVGAPPQLREREAELFRRADLVFTGGRSLYAAKRHQHRRVHLFPSSVDRAHFERARRPIPEPSDQAGLARPRIGYCGVIDERMDLDLLAGVAALRPDWQLVMVGPVVKIDPADLPRPANVHYLGSKPYDSLPAYLAGWDVAMMPFARNDATRFISPTKTPEYLAAGRPVVSTSIHDVVTPYRDLGLVRIADTPAGFVAAAADAMAEDPAARLGVVDAFLAESSWDRTWEQMARLVERAVLARAAAA
jgi:UDP-galactopyranose mutase